MDDAVGNDEQWKDIAGYEGVYQISSCGRVKSLARAVTRSNGHQLHQRERILKPGLDGHGYMFVNLHNHGTRPGFIHRLVATAFVPNPESLSYVDHINRVHTDNRASNLRFVTRTQNAQNKDKRKGTSSMYKGVRITASGTWQSRIRFNGIDISGGTHINEDDAGRAYDCLAKKYFGVYAVLNFP